MATDEEILTEAATTADANGTLPIEAFTRALQRLAVERHDFAGYPMLTPDSPLRLAPGHPYFDKLNGKTLGTLGEDEPHDPEPEIEIVNTWFMEAYKGLPGQVYLLRAPGETKTTLLFLNRWTLQVGMLLQTFDVALHWDLAAEEQAMAKLRDLVRPHIYRYYVTTGAFLESSTRSGVTYVFRRLRPTLALKADPKTGHMRILAALCLHPLAWYQGTWAGAMVPTDDVLAHLLLMRADEHRYWRYANQHAPGTIEAGF